MPPSAFSKDIWSSVGQLGGGAENFHLQTKIIFLPSPKEEALKAQACVSGFEQATGTQGAGA